MNDIFETYKPEGFGTINSYLFVSEPKELISFLKQVFWAKEINQTIDKEGNIANSILKIGQSCIMLSQARGQFLNMSTALYLFVDDVDKIHQRAIDNGAEVIFGPEDIDYGDRQSGIKDPLGNYWWISKRLVNEQYN